MRKLWIAVAALLALGACQKAADQTAPAATVSAPVSEAATAAATRIAAMSVEDRCGGSDPSAPTPAAPQILDFGGGAYGFLTDCFPIGGVMWRTLHVLGTDGVLKIQPFINWNGPASEFEAGYDWEPGTTSSATWDAAARELVWVNTWTIDSDHPAANVSTMRWHWDGTKIAMVSAGRVTKATPDAAPTNVLIGWPTTPATPDPTPAATPV